VEDWRKIERKKKRPAPWAFYESSAIGAQEGGVGHWTEVETKVEPAVKFSPPKILSRIRHCLRLWLLRNVSMLYTSWLMNV
jgi:hypothetical protein